MTEAQTQEIVQTWQLPDINAKPHVQAKNLETDPNYQTGYKHGYQKALLDAEEKFQKKFAHDQQNAERNKQTYSEKIKKVDEILAVLKQPYEQLTYVIEQECVLLASVLAEKLYQKAIEADPQQLLNLILSAKMQLPCATQSIRIKCHPNDCQRIKQCDDMLKLEGQVEFIEDEKCRLGEFILKTDKAYIDGTLRQRLGRLIDEQGSLHE